MFCVYSPSRSVLWIFVLQILILLSSIQFVRGQGCMSPNKREFSFLDSRGNLRERTCKYAQRHQKACRKQDLKSGNPVWKICPQQCNKFSGCGPVKCTSKPKRKFRIKRGTETRTYRCDSLEKRQDWCTKPDRKRNGQPIWRACTAQCLLQSKCPRINSTPTPMPTRAPTQEPAPVPKFASLQIGGAKMQFVQSNTTARGRTLWEGTNVNRIMFYCPASDNWVTTYKHYRDLIIRDPKVCGGVEFSETGAKTGEFYEYSWGNGNKASVGLHPSTPGVRPPELAPIRAPTPAPKTSPKGTTGTQSLNASCKSNTSMVTLETGGLDASKIAVITKGFGGVSRNGNKFLYTPHSIALGTESFVYSVTSKAGESHIVTVTVHVESLGSLQIGGANMQFVPSNTTARGRTLWEGVNVNRIIFYCPASDNWVTTSKNYRDLIIRDPKVCGGFEHSESGAKIGEFYMYGWGSGNKAYADCPSAAPFDPVTDEQVLALSATPQNPVSDIKAQALLFQEGLKLRKTPPEKVVAHRDAEAIYGSIPAGAPRITQQVQINTNRNMWLPTGMYAAPGDLVTVMVPDVLVNKGYNIRVNAHVENIAARESWERPPLVHRYFPINSNTVQVANAFGGSILIDFGRELNDRFKPGPGFGVQTLTISGAIRQPYFALGVHTDQQWISTIKNYPAPVAVFECDELVLIDKASNAEKLTKPTALMQLWQEVSRHEDYMASYDLRGPRQGPDLIDVDVQTNAGAANAGFPITAWSKHWDNVFDFELLRKTGSWGNLHELGHVHQRGWGNGGWWTFAEGTEITVNIFSAYVLHKMNVKSDDVPGWGWTVKPGEEMNKALDVVKSGPSFSKFKGYKLPFYIQLARGFGWETMRKVIRSYEVDYKAGRLVDFSQRSQSEKKCEWLKRYSKIVERDLRDFMVNKWKLEVPVQCQNEVAAMNLPTWLPPGWP